MIEIQYVNTNVEINTKDYILWLKNVIKEEFYIEGNVGYVFCEDEYLLSINQQYLQHDTYTDIITFPLMDENSKVLSGEIYISIERIKDNAEKFQVSLRLELARVLVHGILHLCGYDDHTDEEKRQMRSKEDYYLSLLPKI
ncbi:MAG: rRNA maturation RNase YbeY [Bacteroidales bacterium]|nr:rRNA maturation RNase YbeY [Bacteroidales bacterium]